MRCLQIGTHYFPEVKFCKLIFIFFPRRGSISKSHVYVLIHLIPVGAKPEQTILCDQRAAEFDSQDDLGGALCLGEMGQDRIGKKLLKLLKSC